MTTQQACSKFIRRGPLCDPTDFSEQELGEGLARERCPRLERGMHIVRHISNLDHLAHAVSIVACAVHQKPPAARRSGNAASVQKRVGADLESGRESLDVGHGQGAFAIEDL